MAYSILNDIEDLKKYINAHANLTMVSSYKRYIVHIHSLDPGKSWYLPFLAIDRNENRVYRIELINAYHFYYYSVNI